MNPLDRANAQSLIAAESWPEARALLEKAGRDSDDDIDWLALRAEVETGEGHLEEAAELYEKILDHRPEHRAALYNSSLVLSDLGRHDDAMTSLEALIEVEGESAEVLNDLSYEYLEDGHNVPAYLSASRAQIIATDEPQRCLAKLNAATALANMGRRVDARARIDEMLHECTGVCGEREAANELRQSLDPRHPRKTLTGV